MFAWPIPAKTALEGGEGGEEPKFSNDKNINNNSKNNSCRNMRLIYALHDRANSSVIKTWLNFAVQTCNQYNKWTSIKVNNSCCNLFYNANTSMLLYIISS